MLDKDELILIKGNHEDFAQEFVENYKKYLNSDLLFCHHYKNGFIDTISDLLGLTYQELIEGQKRSIELLKSTPFFTKIIPSMLDYYETSNYIFTHGYIPSNYLGYDGKNDLYSYNSAWRNADENAFKNSRVINGMLANSQGVKEQGKTIVCGHFNVNFGHSVLANKCETTDNNAIYTPYYADGIIAIDAFTKVSNKVNCIIIED